MTDMFQTGDSYTVGAFHVVEVKSPEGIPVELRVLANPATVYIKDTLKHRGFFWSPGNESDNRPKCWWKRVTSPDDPANLQNLLGSYNSKTKQLERVEPYPNSTPGVQQNPQLPSQFHVQPIHPQPPQPTSSPSQGQGNPTQPPPGTNYQRFPMQGPSFLPSTPEKRPRPPTPSLSPPYLQPIPMQPNPPTSTSPLPSPSPALPQPSPSAHRRHSPLWQQPLQSEPPQQPYPITEQQQHPQVYPPRAYPTPEQHQHQPQPYPAQQHQPQVYPQHYQPIPDPSQPGPSQAYQPPGAYSASPQPYQPPTTQTYNHTPPQPHQPPTTQTNYHTSPQPYQPPTTQAYFSPASQHGTLAPAQCSGPQQSQPWQPASTAPIHSPSLQYQPSPTPACSSQQPSQPYNTPASTSQQPSALHTTEPYSSPQHPQPYGAQPSSSQQTTQPYSSQPTPPQYTNPPSHPGPQPSSQPYQYPASPPSLSQPPSYPLQVLADPTQKLPTCTPPSYAQLPHSQPNPPPSSSPVPQPHFLSQHPTPAEDPNEQPPLKRARSGATEPFPAAAAAVPAVQSRVLLEHRAHAMTAQLWLMDEIPVDEDTVVTLTEIRILKARNTYFIKEHLKRLGFKWHTVPMTEPYWMYTCSGTDDTMWQRACGILSNFDPATKQVQVGA